MITANTPSEKAFILSGDTAGSFTIASPLIARRKVAIDSYQPSVFIQVAMALPISSGESSWTKWIPLTVTSLCLGKL